MVGPLPAAGAADGAAGAAVDAPAATGTTVTAAGPHQEAAGAASTAAAAAAYGAPAEPAAVCAEPKLFVGALRYDATPEAVRAHFARYGALRHVALLRHPDGRSKGCAMVQFESWAAAEAAAAAENGVQSELTAPRACSCRFADPQRNEQGALCGVTPKKLFIGQVPPGTAAEALREVFAAHGAVADVSLMPPRKPGAMGEQGRGCGGRERRQGGGWWRAACIPGECLQFTRLHAIKTTKALLSPTILDQTTTKTSSSQKAAPLSRSRRGPTLRPRCAPSTAPSRCRARCTR